MVGADGIVASITVLAISETFPAVSPWETAMICASENGISGSKLQVPSDSTVINSSTMPSLFVSRETTAPASPVPAISLAVNVVTLGASGIFASMSRVTGADSISATVCVTDTVCPSPSDVSGSNDQSPDPSIVTVSSATPSPFVSILTTAPGSPVPDKRVPVKTSKVSAVGSVRTASASDSLPAASVCVIETCCASAKGVSGSNDQSPSSPTITVSSTTPSLSRSRLIVAPGSPEPAMSVGVTVSTPGATGSEASITALESDSDTFPFSSICEIVTA